MNFQVYVTAPKAPCDCSLAAHLYLYSSLGSISGPKLVMYNYEIQWINISYLVC